MRDDPARKGYVAFRAIHWPAIRNRAERIISVGLFVVPLLVVVFWLALHHKPGWYRPAHLDEQGMQRARKEAAAMAELVSDQMVGRSAFDVTLSDASITRWIAALPSIWPDGHRRIPSELSDIALAFDDGVVRIGARFEGSWYAIVNVCIEIRISDDGSKLTIEPQQMFGGSVPLPSSVLEGVLRASVRKASLEQTGKFANAAGERETTNGLDDRKITSEIIETENRFVWFNGRRPFRITAIRLVPGKLQLEIEPL